MKPGRATKKQAKAPHRAHTQPPTQAGLRTFFLGRAERRPLQPQPRQGPPAAPFRQPVADKPVSAAVSRTAGAVAGSRPLSQESQDCVGILAAMAAGDLGATPSPREPLGNVCPVCGRTQPDDSHLFSAHVNACLDDSLAAQMAGSPDPHVRPLSPSLPPSAAADFAADLAADEALAFELATGADGSLAFDAGSQQVSDDDGEALGDWPTDRADAGCDHDEAVSPPASTAAPSQPRRRVLPWASGQAFSTKGSNARPSRPQTSGGRGAWAGGGGGSSGESRPCPSFKHIPHTTFTVDAFAYGKISGCTAYFLTHFHSDHYGGLRKSFDHGALWCSAVTANLVAQQIGVDRSFLHVLPLDTPTEIEGVRVTFIDANQLIMILFEVPRMGSDGAQTGTYRLLHTGDFRASPAHLEHLALAPFVRAQGGSVSIGTDKADDDDASAPAIDDLFLDTTYCQPKHVFPPQTAVIDAICELVKGVAAGKTVQTIVNPKNTVARFFVAKPRGGAVGAAAGTLFSWMGGASAPPRPLRVLIVVGSYLIGKERVFKALAKAVGTKVFADADKRRILARLADRELDGMMTSRPEDANVHVVGMGKLNKEHLAAMLARHKDRFSEVIAVRPTGWTFGGRGPGKGRADDDGEPAPFTVQSLAVQHLAHNIKLVPLPYSEHSSFSELEMFVRGLRVASIVPTVSEASTALLRRFCVRRTRG